MDKSSSKQYKVMIGIAVGLSVFFVWYFYKKEDKKEDKIDSKKSSIPVKKIFTEEYFNKINTEYFTISRGGYFIENLIFKGANKITSNNFDQYKFVFAKKNSANELYLLHGAIRAYVFSVDSVDIEAGYYAIDKTGNAYQIFDLKVKNFKGSHMSHYEPTILYVDHENEEENFYDYFKNLFERVCKDDDNGFKGQSATGGLKLTKDENSKITFDLEISKFFKDQ